MIPNQTMLLSPTLKRTAGRVIRWTALDAMLGAVGGAVFGSACLEPSEDCCRIRPGARHLPVAGYFAVVRWHGRDSEGWNVRPPGSLTMRRQWNWKWHCPRRLHILHGGSNRCLNRRRRPNLNPKTAWRRVRSAFDSEKKLLQLIGLRGTELATRDRLPEQRLVAPWL